MAWTSKKELRNKVESYRKEYENESRLRRAASECRSLLHEAIESLVKRDPTLSGYVRDEGFYGSEIDVDRLVNDLKERAKEDEESEERTARDARLDGVTKK